MKEIKRKIRRTWRHVKNHLKGKEACSKEFIKEFTIANDINLWSNYIKQSKYVFVTKGH